MQSLEPRIVMSAVLINSVFPVIPAAGITVDGMTYFDGSDTVHGSELWRTDGTAEGTAMVADLNPGTGGTGPLDLFNFNGTLIFEETIGRTPYLFRSDGTAAGTSAVVQLGDFTPSGFTQVGNQLYFFSHDSSGNEVLCRTDGTAVGTSAVQNLGGTTASMANLDGTLYYLAPDLWKIGSDGQPERVGSFGTDADDLIACNHRLYFASFNPNAFQDSELWTSDGTAAGTSILFFTTTDLNSIPAPFEGLYAFDNDVYFVSNYRQILYRTDGTAAGTVLLATPGAIDLFDSFVPFGGNLYFMAGSNSQASKLWATDGTVASTRTIFSISPPLSGHLSLLVGDNALFFISNDQLYQTDGTTTSLADSAETAAGWSVKQLIGQAQGGLVFGAWTPPSVQQLWSLSATAPPPASTLVPSLGDVSLKADVIAGNPLGAGVPVIITNQGTTAFSGNVMINVYLDGGTTFDGSQVLLASRRRHVSLKPGRQARVVVNVKTVPASLESAVDHLIAQVVEPSGNSGSVATTQTVQIVARSAQPSVWFASEPGAVTLKPGRGGTIVAVITNQGNVPLTGGTLTLSLSTLTAEPGPTLETIHVASALPPGRTRRFRLHFTLPPTLAAGRYFTDLLVSGVGASLHYYGVPFTVS